MSMGAFIGCVITAIACFPLIIALIYIACRTLWYIFKWAMFPFLCCWVSWAVLFGVEEIAEAIEDIKGFCPVW